MSSLHITSWTAEEITNWIKGLDSDLEQYIPTFLAHQVTGDRLLKMTKQELEDMKMTKMGHQELMLEAIDLLSLVHYGHPTETLQSVALNLNCKASNLASLLDQRLKSGNHPNDRLYCKPSTILLRVSETISAAKTLISWLDRPPFSNGPEKDFQEFSKDILHYALEMTQAVQLHTDLTGALPEIVAIARELAAIADNLIKQSTDPLVIQPTTIEEVRIKKKRPEEELGLFIKTSTIDGIHYITGTKDQSAASLSRKIGPGDELLRVNEQTVISWEHCKVVTALKCDPMGVCLTLRKRPCNLGSPGQILRPGNSPYSMRLGGTPQLMRKDSFPTMKSPIMKEEFLMPMSPNDLLISKQRSNSDPETKSETHETHSDSESLVQEAERIKRQRRGTMGEGLQRKGSKGQTTEGRPRSLPINTEELEADLALWKASPISTRPGFSPIAGSPVSPATTSSTQTSPVPYGDKTSTRTTNPLDGVAIPNPHPKKMTTFKVEEPSPSNVSASDTTTILSKPELEISKPTEDASYQDPTESPTSVDTLVSSEADQRNPDETESPSALSPTSATSNKPISESVEAKNTNNNVAASAEQSGQREVPDDLVGIVTTEHDDFIVIDADKPITPTKSVSFIERTQSTASELSVSSTTVKLRPKKTKKLKYKVTRGVSCVDLGPGECQGWLYKKSNSKQTFRSSWVEMWFVLKDFVLYYYKSKTDTKAKGVICLPGYLISEAPESKKDFAFKACHTGTKPIYFVAQHQQDMEKWTGKLGLAAVMYTDKKKMRQSVIFQSQASQEVGAMMQSVDGYQSESDDEDKKSDQSAPWSPSSSDRSDENSSEVGSPQPEFKHRRTRTSPNLHSRSDESGSPTALPKLYLKKSKDGGAACPNSPKSSPKIMQRMMDKLRRHSRGSLSIESTDLSDLQGNYAQRRNSSPFDDALSQPFVTQPPTVSITSPASPKVSNDKPIQGAALREDTIHEDALLDHYMSLMVDNGCVSGLERTKEARTSKRFSKKGKGLTRIQTILDKNPEKNKKALQKRTLQRTLKSKQEELLQLEGLLSETTLSSSSIQEWRMAHEDIVDHVLRGPSPQSPSDSDSDMDGDQNDKESTNRNPHSGGNAATVNARSETELPSGSNISGSRDVPVKTSTEKQGPPKTKAKSTNTRGNISGEVCSGGKNSDKGEPGHETNIARSAGTLESEPSSALLEVSGMAMSSLILDDAGSEASESSF